MVIKLKSFDIFDNFCKLLDLYSLFTNPARVLSVNIKPFEHLEIHLSLVEYCKVIYK